MSIQIPNTQIQETIMKTNPKFDLAVKQLRQAANNLSASSAQYGFCPVSLLASGLVLQMINAMTVGGSSYPTDGHAEAFDKAIKASES